MCIYVFCIFIYTHIYIDFIDVCVTHNFAIKMRVAGNLFMDLPLDLWRKQNTICVCSVAKNRKKKKPGSVCVCCQLTYV